MKKLILVSLIPFLTCVLSPPPVVAGPWTILEDEVFISLSHIVSSFDRFYNQEKKKFPLPDNVVNHDTILDLYYGFTEDWEANLRFTGYKSTRDFPGDEHSQTGFGDGWVNVKHHFYHGFFDVAAQAGVKWPGDYDAELINSPGDGQTDVEFRFLLGKFWDRFYIDLELAYLNRFGDPPNEHQLYLDMGYALTSYLRVRCFRQRSDARAGQGSAGAAGTVLPKTEEDVIVVGGGLTWTPKKDLSLTLQYATVLEGRNTPKQTHIGVNASYRFDLFVD